MKRLLFLAFFAASFGIFTSHAQNFNGYAVFGFNGSQVIGDAMTGYNKPGLFMGFKVAFPFSEKLDMTMAINYVQKGSRRTYNRDGLPNGGAWHLMRANYIEVPFLFHRDMAWLSPRIRAYAGLSVARLLNARIDWFSIGSLSEFDRARDYDLSYHYGLSYVASDKWVISVTNSHSYLSFDNQMVSTVFYKWRLGMFHNVLNFEFAYQF